MDHKWGAGWIKNYKRPYSTYTASQQFTRQEVIMAGTKEGGIKARDTNIKRQGKDFYTRIGHIGGSRSTGGGFASEKVGKDGLTGTERAKIAGRKGGQISKRGKAKH